MKKYSWANRIVIVTLWSIVFICLVSMASSRQKIYSEVEVVSMNPTKEDESFEIWTLEGKMEEVLEETLIKYQKEYPDIKFSVKVFKNDIYSETLLNAARTGSLPDMFYSWGDERLKELVELDVAKDITSEVYKQVGGKLNEGVLKNYCIDERIYGMPAFAWNTVLYCNTDLFKACELEIPTTYDEFLEVVKQFKEKQITPLMIGGSEAWMASLYYMELVSEEENTTIIKGLSSNPLYFRRDGFVNAATQFKALIDLEPWQQGYENMLAVDAVNGFAKGKAAMLVSGSWSSSNIDDINHSLIKGKVAVIPFPGNRTNSLKSGVAGYSDGFILNRMSELDQVNVKALFVRLMQDISDRAVEKKGMGLPVYREQSLENTKFETLKLCEHIFPKEDFHAAYDKILSTQFIKGYNEALIEFIREKSSVTEFIEAVATGKSKN